MKNTLLFFCALFSQIVFGQIVGEKEVRGKIISDSIAAGGINIVNISNGTAAISNEKGLFFIFAKEGDVLMFSAVNLVTLRKQLNSGDIKSAIVLVQMTSKSIGLEEVVVNESSRITAEGLGIIPYGQKKYTPAERKLYTANSGFLDKPLNWMSGRTAKLKKEVVIEQKERQLLKLGYLFTDGYYTETLRIPSEYIRGFQYYCIDDSDFVGSLTSKNKTLSMFLIIALAEKYKKNINR